EAGSYQHLWVMDGDGGHRRQLTRGKVFDEWPCFAPNGARILFTRSSSRAAALYTVSLADGRVSKASPEGVTAFLGVFTRKGDIVFRGGRPVGLWILAQGALDVRYLGAGYAPAPSPVREAVAFLADWGARNVWV